MHTVFLFLFSVLTFVSTSCASSPIQEKSALVKQQIQAALNRGENPQEAIKLAQQIPILMRQGKVKQVNANLDQALKLLNNPQLVVPVKALSEIHPPYELIKVSGEPAGANGIYDPSVEYNQDGSVGWLAYTAVDSSRDFLRDTLATHLAKTTDNGKTWVFVKVINPNQPSVLTLANGAELTGNWRHEVPSLVFDPKDEGREWKLFTHKYFWNEKKDRMPAYGWIALRTAHTPDGDWSEEIPLFGSEKFPPKPFEVKFRLHTLHPSLTEAVVCTEPGAMVYNDTLYLSLTTVMGDGPSTVILLSSLDHGKNWKYVGVLLDRSIASAFGFKKWDGSALVCEKGLAYLMATPQGNRAMHEGTYIFEFLDINQAALKKDDEGNPLVIKRIQPDPNFFSQVGAGQSDYHEFNTYGGIIFPQINLNSPQNAFRFFNTHQGVASHATGN
jgi:hypothetical protein